MTGAPGPAAIDGVRHLFRRPAELPARLDAVRASPRPFVARAIAPGALAPRLAAFQGDNPT